MRWRDKIRSDLKSFNIREDNWFQLAQGRGEWRAACKEGLCRCAEERLEKDKQRRCGKVVTDAAPFVCDVCHRAFRRRQDMPSIIARHKCQRSRDAGRQAPSIAAPPAVPPRLVCDSCGRSFRRRQDIARHKCQTTRHRQII